MAVLPWLARWLLSWLALAIGVVAIAAIWLALAMLSDTACSWLALVAAADMALMLRLTHAPPGWGRRATAVFATALAIAASQWFIVASYFGQTLGLGPVESAKRLGPVLAWAMTQQRLQPLDWWLVLGALPLAAWWAGSGRKL